MLENCYIGFLNMDHRVDRLQHMEFELSKAQVKAIRHRGKRPQEYDLNDPRVRIMRDRTPGAISCHFGQVGIIQTAQAMGLNALVLEDDCVFCSDFKERLEIIEGFTDSHPWDIVWLGGTFHVPAFWHKVGGSGMPPNCSRELGRDCETTDHPRMIRTFGAFSTFAYIVNFHSIDKILTRLDAILYKSIGIDFAMICLQPDLQTFAFVPGCVKQMDNQSDIGSGMTIFSGFSKLNGTIENSRYWFQDKMDDFDPESFVFV